MALLSILDHREKYCLLHFQGAIVQEAKTTIEYPQAVLYAEAQLLRLETEADRLSKQKCQEAREQPDQQQDR